MCPSELLVQYVTQQTGILMCSLNGNVLDCTSTLNLALTTRARALLILTLNLCVGVCVYVVLFLLHFSYLLPSAVIWLALHSTSIHWNILPWCGGVCLWHISCGRGSIIRFLWGLMPEFVLELLPLSFCFSAIQPMCFLTAFAFSTFSIIRNGLKHFAIYDLVVCVY